MGGYRDRAMGRALRKEEGGRVKRGNEKTVNVLGGRAGFVGGSCMDLRKRSFTA